MSIFDSTGDTHLWLKPDRGRVRAESVSMCFVSMCMYMCVHLNRATQLRQSQAGMTFFDIHLFANHKCIFVMLYSSPYILCVFKASAILYPMHINLYIQKQKRTKWHLLPTVTSIAVIGRSDSKLWACIFISIINKYSSHFFKDPASVAKDRCWSTKKVFQRSLQTGRGQPSLSLCTMDEKVRTMFRGMGGGRPYECVRACFWRGLAWREGRTGGFKTWHDMTWLHT